MPAYAFLEGVSVLPVCGVKESPLIRLRKKSSCPVKISDVIHSAMKLVHDRRRGFHQHGERPGVVAQFPVGHAPQLLGDGSGRI